MDLYKRYLNGDTKAVYDDINKLGDKAFNILYKEEIETVLTETFERVAYNLDLIYKELINIGYLFKTEYKFNFEKPIHPPLENTELLLAQLNDSVKPFGYVPLSLKYFYKIVGGVNFVWDYETNGELLWNMADPIQICSLDSITEEVLDEYWQECMTQEVEDGGCAYLDLAADDLHKDNVSGGSPYAIQITKEPSIDALFMNEANETSFINYLRICFEYCGFPGITSPDLNNDYHEFFAIVKPRLKLI